MSKKLKIGITQGDTNGVGWEIILKTFSDAKMFEICTPIIYGSVKVGEYYKSLSEEFDAIQFNKIESLDDLRKVKLNIIECGEVETITPGEPSSMAGMAAIEALARATEDLKSGVIDGIVTAPFNKKTVQSSEFAHPGHTEFMEAQLGGKSMMMMCSELLKVGLVTKHIPLDQVAKTITKEGIVADLKHLRKTLIADFEIVEPRIAVLALNPHAGDESLLGSDEVDVIKPAIVEAYNEGVLAFGPFAADGFFAARGYAKYDAVLAMYHDQGLIPFKTLSPEGVNFTAGLSKVRTSPDHGVAYDIAGKGVADSDSMRNAIYLAIDVMHSRERHAEVSANPLKFVPVEEERGERHRQPRREFPKRGDRPEREHREPREPREHREPRGERVKKKEE